MFTGIIKEKGTLEKIEHFQNRLYLMIKCSIIQNELVLGDSVSCNGICLTVVDYDNNFIKVEVMVETGKKTDVYNWTKNDIINLENALTLKGKLDGHLVYGHVDTIGTITGVRYVKETLYLEISYPTEFRNHIVPQGSITIDGVSLTVAKLTNDRFTVAVIEHTLKNTNLQALKHGDRVNIEFDVVGKFVLRFLENKNNDAGKMRFLSSD